MTLFDPGPFHVGDLATARLLGTSRTPDAVIATYRLEPRDPGQFQERLGSLFDALGRPYAPVPGLWATVDLVPGRDELGLLVGLSRVHGQGRAVAHRAFGATSGSLVEPAEIRALLAGYLRRAGV